MPLSRVIIELADRPTYNVRIGSGVAAALGANMKDAGLCESRCVALLDSDASERCLPVLRESLSQAGITPIEIVVPAFGEDEALSCLEEIYRAFDMAKVSPAIPVVVCASTALSELGMFAAATYGGGQQTIVLPASFAAALRTLACDYVELDCGLARPLRALCAPAFAACDPSLLAAAGAEREAGSFELSQAALFCDADFQEWLAGKMEGILDGDAESATLALAQAIAARADALGAEVQKRVSA